MERLNAWLVVGMMLLVGTIVIVVIGNIIGNAEEAKAPASEIFGHEITSLCDAPEDVEMSGVLPAEDDYPRKLALLDGDNFSEFQEQLPAEWFAENVDELDIVICVDTEQITLQECEYQAEDNSDEQAILYRTNAIATLYAFTPGGSLFDIIKVEGDAPHRCPYDMFLRENGEREFFQDGALDYALIEESLEPLIKASTNEQ